MIRSKTNQSADIVFDALSLSADLITRGGSVRQMFYTNEQTYEDDRRYVPCILDGFVYANDPANIMTGEVPLSDIEWYTRMPIENDYATGRITNPSEEVLNDVDVIDPETGEITHEAAWRSCDYLISDGSNRPWCEDVPEMCLIVRKNVPQLTSMPIYGVLKFIDTRTGLTMRVLKSKDFSTEVYDADAVTMRGDCGDELLLDPLSFTDTIPSGKTIIDIPWTRTINVQLQGGEGDIADASANYLWVVEETDSNVAPTGWREFNAIEKAAMNISGEKTKSLSLDTRLINGSLSLRCYGGRRESGESWSSPLTDEHNPFYEVRLTMIVPGTTPGTKRKPQGDNTTQAHVLMATDKFVAEPVQVTGNRQNAAMSIPCHYDMKLRYNGHDVPANKRSLFLFHWWGQNLKTGEVNSLGYGPTLDFVPNQYGYTYPEGFVVWADVEMFICMGVVKDSGNIVLDDGKVVICGIFG